MDIRTKVVFALVAVALASMSALGFAVYQGVERELSGRTLDRLDGLAEFKVDAIERVLEGWHDRVALVASRTQLRRSLAARTGPGDTAAAAEIQRILGDAFGVVPLIEALSVHDVDGQEVARVGEPGVPLPGPEGARQSTNGTEYLGLAISASGDPAVRFSARLEIDGELVGFLEATLATSEVVALSENYYELGATGETMVVTRDSTGAPWVLHPVRSAPVGPIVDEFGVRDSRSVADGPSTSARLSVATDEAARLAADGVRAERAGGLTDYRGQEVWAVTRFLPETAWGVVVKIDADEQLQPILGFRDGMIRLALTLAAFAVVVGTFLGFLFTKPILALTEAAGRIHQGDLSTRTRMTREDEVGFLGRTFDEMAESLEDKVELLTEFRRFFDVSIDLMCIASSEGYFKRVNPAFTRELGWSEEELLSKPFVSMVHPDDVEATHAEMDTLEQGRPSIRFKNRYLCLDGTYKHLQWNAYPEGDTNRIYAIARVRDPKPPVIP